MEKPKVLVIIPVYNGEKTLRPCLSSVLNQTYENYEVIAIDNNSTDNTKDIIKEFQEKNKSLFYIFESSIGRSSARNAGIKKADGEIIAMTDSDCIVPDNWIEELIQPIIYENEFAVTGSEDDLVKNYWTKNIQKANSAFVKLGLNDNYASNVDTKNFAIKSALMKELMFDPNIKALEDFELYLRLKRIAKIRFLPFIKVGHRHPYSFCKLVTNNFQRAYWAKRIFDKHRKDLDLKNDIMLQSISFKNFLVFPLWMVFQFIKRPIGEAYFILVSEVSWRVGIIWSIIKKEG